MKITNHIAGEWKLFGAEMPPEKDGVWIGLIIDKPVKPYYRYCANRFDGDRRLWVDYEGHGINCHDLMMIYNAYCVIQEPWE